MPRSQLDPHALDGIVQELNLQDADTIDRFVVWYRDLMTSLWSWLKTQTGGEDGWLSQFNDWLDGILSDWGQSEPIGTGVVDVLAWLTVALIVGLLLYLGHQLWRLYRPRTIPEAVQRYAMQHQALLRPLNEMTLAQQAPALFIQVGLRLAQQGLATVETNTTNSALARSASLPMASQHHLDALAEAADRALFNDWTPSADEMMQLRRHRDALYQALPEFG